MSELNEHGLYPCCRCCEGGIDPDLHARPDFEGHLVGCATCEEADEVRKLREAMRVHLGRLEYALLQFDREAKFQTSDRFKRGHEAVRGAFETLRAELWR